MEQQSFTGITGHRTNSEMVVGLLEQMAHLRAQGLPVTSCHRKLGDCLDYIRFESHKRPAVARDWGQMLTEEVGMFSDAHIEKVTLAYIARKLKDMGL